MVFPRVFARVFSMEAWIAGGVFVAVAVVVIFAVVHSRARPGRTPSSRAKINPLEIAYALVLAGVAAFLVVSTTMANGAERRSPGRPALRVQITAYQWCWRFHYVGTPVTVNGQCQDGKYPTLRLPAGRTVAITLRSHDVIHSFWVPALRFKMDVFPGKTNSFRFRPDRQGRWIGRCAEFCGVDHSDMDFYLQTDDARTFDRWLAGAAA